MAEQSDEKTRDGASSRWSRRSFIKGVAASAVTTETLLGRVTEAQQAPAGPSATAVNTPIKGEIKLTLSINDQNREMSVEPRTTLLDKVHRRNLIAAGYEQVKQFDWERTGREVLQIYREIKQHNKREHNTLKKYYNNLFNNNFLK